MLKDDTEKVDEYIRWPKHPQPWGACYCER